MRNTGEAGLCGLQKSCKHPAQSPATRVAGLCFYLPLYSRVFALSVAFATPLEIPSPLQHSRPSIPCLAVVSSCCTGFGFASLSLRSGALGRRGPGHSSVVTAPPTAFKGSREARSPISRFAPSHSPDRGCTPSKARYGRARGGLRLATAARNRLWRKGAPLHGLPRRGTVPRRGTARAFAPLRVPRLGRSPRRGCPLFACGVGWRSARISIFSQWRRFAIAGARRQWGRGQVFSRLATLRLLRLSEAGTADQLSAYAAR